MKKLSLLTLSVGIAISGGLFAQAASVKPGSVVVSDVLSTAQPFLPLATITEGFDGSATTTAGCALTPAMTTAGWFAKNNSLPVGASCWNVLANSPVPTAPAPQAGAGYVVSNFNVGTLTAQHSAWLVTPRVTFGTGATLEFWARAGGTFADQMEVRISTAADAGTPDVGTAATDVGTFTSLALTINPTSALVSADQACPVANFTATGATHTGFATSQWCKFTITGAALPASGTGRIAFRNSVPNGGPDGANSNIIRMDSFSFVEGTAGGTTITPGTPAGAVTIPPRTLPTASATATLSFTASAASSTTCVATGAGYSVAPSPLTLPAGTAASVTVTQNSAAAGTYTGTITCTNAAGASPASFVYNFTHVVNGAAAAPAFNATTPSNTPATPILLSRTLPAGTSTSALVFSVTGADGALTCTTSSPGYSVAPSPLNLVVGTPGTVTVTHSGTTAGTFTGLVTCTGPVGSTGGPFNYNFSTTVSGAPIVLVPTPALNVWGALALLAGLGLFGVFAVRRFS